MNVAGKPSWRVASGADGRGGLVGRCALWADSAAAARPGGHRRRLPKGSPPDWAARFLPKISGGCWQRAAR